MDEIWPRLTAGPLANAMGGAMGDAIAKLQQTLAAARQQIESREQQALVGSVEQLERMLTAFRGALDRMGASQERGR